MQTAPLMLSSLIAELLFVIILKATTTAPQIFWYSILLILRKTFCNVKTSYSSIINVFLLAQDTYWCIYRKYLISGLDETKARGSQHTTLKTSSCYWNFGFLKKPRITLVTLFLARNQIRNNIWSGEHCSPIYIICSKL